MSFPTSLSREDLSYNAVNVLLKGDWRALKRANDKYSSWVSAWEDLKRNSGISLETEAEKLIKNDIGIILAGAEDFPKALKEIQFPPFGIYFKGRLDLRRPAVSVVGTRKATLPGQAVAKDFSKKLAENGVAVISGLAMGLDTAAHEGALSGGGHTIAVLANSLESVYPRQNKNLAEKILASGGGLISEYPVGSETFAHRFLERNRIVSGLSLGTLVVEAPEGSGSLVTANLALEQNRQVFVIPGPVNHPNYHGSHQLIRAGATLVSRPEEILDDLNLIVLSPTQSIIKPVNHSALNEKQEILVEAIRTAGEPVDVDKIGELTKIDVLDINRHLTFLLIKGLIKESSGKYTIWN